MLYIYICVKKKKPQDYIIFRLTTGTCKNIFHFILHNAIVFVQVVGSPRPLLVFHFHIHTHTHINKFFFFFSFHKPLLSELDQLQRQFYYNVRNLYFIRRQTGLQIRPTAGSITQHLNTLGYKFILLYRYTNTGTFKKK